MDMKEAGIYLVLSGNEKQENTKDKSPDYMPEISVSVDRRTQLRKPWKSASRVHGNVSLSSRLEAPRKNSALDSTVTMGHLSSRWDNPQASNTAKTIAHKEMPSQPSVIARLMGIDTIPTTSKGGVIMQPEEMKPLSSSTTEIKVMPPRSSPFKNPKCGLLSYRGRHGDSRQCLKKMRVPGRSRSWQRHPQEDLLQKIKEDFQKWQTSKALESARTVTALGNSSAHLDGRCIQIIAQENLRKEKMARYGFGHKVIGNECSKKSVVQETNPEHVANVEAEAKSEKTVIKVLRTPEKFRGLEVGKGGQNHCTYENLHSPTRIVLLKPTSDIDSKDGEMFFGLSKVKRDESMEEFIQEVKERLKKELKMNARSELSTICWATEPKEIARDIAKRIKQTVNTNLGRRLSRSEAFRAFRGDRKRESAKHAYPEHIKLDTRKVLDQDQRPKSVTSRTETISPEKYEEESINLLPIKSRRRARSLTGVSLSGVGSDEQNCTGDCLMKNNVVSEVAISSNIFSPHKLVRLVRSFSAPESGISRGKLYVDDSVGSRKHGGASEISSESGAVTSGSFSFRGTVSSLRQSFSLRRKLFGKKTHSSKKPFFEELKPQMAINMSPSPSESFRLLNVAQASFTELPPSPVSPLEVVGHSSSHFFSDLNLNCNFPELSPKCLSESEAPASELSYMTGTTVETSCNQDKAYIREVLIAAGLYDDGSIDNKANARVDSMARPICDDVFEEVEDIYYYRDMDMGHDIGMYNDTGVLGNPTDHRMLFDLANEALQCLVETAKTGSSLRQWVIDSTGVSRGRKLVDDVWQQVQALKYPQMQEMQTIEGMVEYEVRKYMWMEVLYEDVYVVGRKIERAIFDELIEGLLTEVDVGPKPNT
ncbi:hypothetical protein ACP4OV_014051 [Aristida adscensionis]